MMYFGYFEDFIFVENKLKIAIFVIQKHIL